MDKTHYDALRYAAKHMSWLATEGRSVAASERLDPSACEWASTAIEALAADHGPTKPIPTTPAIPFNFTIESIT